MNERLCSLKLNIAQRKYLVNAEIICHTAEKFFKKTLDKSYEASILPRMKAKASQRYGLFGVF